MDLTFLSASDGTPLAKSFIKSSRGLSKNPYPLVKNFTSHTTSVTSITDFFDAIKLNAKHGLCLLKGKLLKELIDEPRAGQHDLSAPTEWMVIDIDDLRGFEEVDEVLSVLALEEVDHIVQYSASMGVDPNKALSAHVFFLLTEPVEPSALKNWLMHVNLSIPGFRSQVTLNASKMAVRWPIDPTVAQADKLIYIAPPVLHGLTDTLTIPRISLALRAQRTFTLPRAHDMGANVEKAKVALVNELRAKEGLEERKFWMRPAFGTEVLRNPDQVKSWRVAYQARGYTYLDLNGGDSHAYWHPDDCIDIIYNFKGEPAYSTKELIPEYYAQKLEERRTIEKQTRERMRAETKRLQAEAREREREEHVEEREQNRAEREQQRIQALVEAQERTRGEFEDLAPPGLRYIIAEDRATGRYWRGTYDFESGELILHPARNRQSLIDFAVQNVGFKPAYIPQWDVEYDFTTLQRIDVATRFLNLFEPTRYMTEPSMAISEPLHVVCPRVFSVLDHVMGNDAEARDHFLNWLAFIWQRRVKAKTAWVMHGTQGTGKGLLFHNIIRPLFGEKLAQIRTLDMLEEPYNGYMQHTLILFIDESTTDKIKNLSKVVNKVKNWVTDPTIPVRIMHLDQFDAPNFANLIFASNATNPISIDPNDRRFNVAPRQESKFEVTDKQLQELEKELPIFASFLTHFAVDDSQVRTVLLNTARQDVQDSTSDAPQDVARALLSGDLRFLINQLPQQDLALSTVDMVVTAYKQLIAKLVDAVRKADGVADMPILREDVQTVFQHCLGWEHSSPHKFTKIARRFGISIKEHWMPSEGKTLRGFRVSWKAKPEDIQLFDSLTEHSTRIRVVK